MLKIGHFSKIARIPAKTLRFYDEMGLLKPALVDRESGYRYYSLDQLPRLNRIMALKDLGFTLSQTAQLLDGDLSAAQIEGMLLLKQAEVEQQIQMELDRLARIKMRLYDIQQESELLPYDVVLKPVPAMLILSLRRTVDNYTYIGALFTQFYQMVGPRGIDYAGSPLCNYHDMEYIETNADVEVAVPVSQARHPAEPLQEYILPSVETMVTTLHYGNYDTLPLAYLAIGRWVQANNYELAAPIREIYLRGPGKDYDPSTYVTELHFPVQKIDVKG